MPDEEVALEALNAFAAVDLLVSDLWGVARGKRVFPEEYDDLRRGGIRLPGAALALEVGDRVAPALGVGADCLCRPVPGTLAPVPWDGARNGQVIVELAKEDGAPYALDPRAVLGRVIRRFAQDGLTPVVALEVEFYLLAKTEGDADPDAAMPRSVGRAVGAPGTYEMARLGQVGRFLDEVAAACRAQGIPVRDALAERGPGQYEVTLTHQADARAAADHAFLLKRAVKALADRHGMIATFMAKPFAETAGSGTHVHVSLRDATGANVFDPGQPGADRALARAAAGLTATMGEMMAIFAPNANSYRRFQKGQLAPVKANLGSNDRSSAVRIPSGSPAARRIEHRVAGADANPYLVAAAVLAGMHHGLKVEVAAQPNADFVVEWSEALRRVDAGSVARDYLGADYLHVFSARKRREWEVFQGHVSPLEYAWYLHQA